MYLLTSNSSRLWSRINLLVALRTFAQIMEEYFGTKVSKFLEKYGIIHQHSIPHTP